MTCGTISSNYISLIDFFILFIKKAKSNYEKCRIDDWDFHVKIVNINEKLFMTTVRIFFIFKKLLIITLYIYIYKEINKIIGKKRGKYSKMIK